jgi:sterol O-acyltransferase
MLIDYSWPFLRNWTWTAQVFFTLHLLVLFMKMHSYAFYSGHLSETKRRLDSLDDPMTIAGRPTRTPLVRYPSTTTHIAEIRKLQDEETKANPTQSLTELREELAVEITSPLGHVTYPANLTFSNFFDYLCCPTLCYELEYPRTASIRPMELLWKGLAVFGCIFLMTLTTEEFVLPVLDEARVLLQSTHGLLDSALVFAEVISRLLFPFMVIFLLVFLVIFEYLCGFFAEITCKFSHSSFVLLRTLLTDC